MNTPTPTPATVATAPEALRLAAALDSYATGDEYQWVTEQAADELRRLHALTADTYSAADMATAAAQGFRDGQAAQPGHHALQAEGKHPAPCARHCEAPAFKITIRNLESQLQAARAQPAAAQVVDEIGEQQPFEAWVKFDCPVEGANAKIAAKAAWKARAKLAAPAVAAPTVSSEALDLAEQLVKAESSKSRMHEKYMGKVMPDDDYARFCRLRDDVVPTLRKRLVAMLAAAPQPPAVGQEPIGYLYCGGLYGDELADWEIVADQYRCEKLNEHHGSLGKEAKLPIYTHPAPADAEASACLTCNGHGAVGNILTAEPCPDCTPIEAAPAQGDAEDALRRVLSAVQRYLPPDGPTAHDAMSEIIGIVDPWPLGHLEKKA